MSVEGEHVRTSRRAEYVARTLTDREVSDIRALSATGSNRDVVRLVERIVADHCTEAWGDDLPERAAQRVEREIRHLLAVPSDVTKVDRETLALDLQQAADEIRRLSVTVVDRKEER